MKKIPLTPTCLLLIVCTIVSNNAQAGPDATILSAWTAGGSSTYRPGRSLGISCRVKNVGDEPTGACDINVYASTDTSIGSGDYHLGAGVLQELNPGDDKTVVVSCMFPADIPDGYYYLGAAVSCSGDVNAGNDTYHQTYRIRIVSTPPDVTVARLEIPEGFYRAGERIDLAATVSNLGDRAAAGYTINYYASDHRGTGARDYHLASIGGPGLDPHAQHTTQTTCTVLSSIPQGSYYIKALITCSNDYNPSNDETYSRAIWLGPYGDLAVQSVEVTPGPHAPGNEIVVHTVIRNVGDADTADYNVQYYLSPDTTITTHDYAVGQGGATGLAPGKEHHSAQICRIPSYVPQGECYVGVIVACSNDGRVQNNVGHGPIPVTIVHPPGYVCGRMQYDDLDGRSHPIRYARVRIYAGSGYGKPLSEQVLVSTHTDGNGNYGALLTPEAGGGSEIYVKVFTEGVSGTYTGTASTICAVKDDVLKECYALRSPLSPYPVTSSVTINLTSPKTAGEFMVYDSVVEGFHKALTFFGMELDPVEVYWPTSNNGTYYSPGKGIYIAQHDRGDRDVILHEYGHYVADVQSFARGEVGLNPRHYWNTDLRFSPYYRTNDQARNLAFREAWATFFSIATQHGDTWYPYAGDARYQDLDEITGKTFWVSLEADTYGARSPGEYYENMNCCALWDIFDDHNDPADNRDTLCDPGLGRIWTICREDEPNDILDLWNGWFERYDNAGEMVRIFTHHKMAFHCPTPSPTVDGFETGDLSSLAWTGGGDLPWVVTTGVRHHGAFSAQAGPITDWQKSSLEAKLDCDGGWMYFWRKVSSEAHCDRLQFFIDGIKKIEWSGELDWEQLSYLVGRGQHTFTWTYIKDSSSTDGADTAWIDEVEFPVWPLPE